MTIDKKQLNLTIMSDRKKHKTLDLSALAPVMLDVTNGEAYVDMGALHARSKLERGIKFGTDPEEVPNGIPYAIVWMSTNTNEQGPYIYGAGACRMTIDAEARRGYKLLPEHVNSMDMAMKGRFDLTALTPEERTLLQRFIQNDKPELWTNSATFVELLL